MHIILKHGLLIFLTILFVLLIGYSILGMRRKEAFGGMAKEVVNNMYSANVNFENNIYSILIVDSKQASVATFYTNPVTIATMSNITTVTFMGESSDSLWNNATATISIDNTQKTYTVTCILSDNSVMTFTGPMDDTDTSNSDTSNNDSSNNDSSNNSNTDYENYNHYDGSSYPSIFYGPNGASAKIMNTSGSVTIVFTDSTGKTTIYYSKKNDASSDNKITQTTYHGVNGGTATLTSGNNGQYVIKVVRPDGRTSLYYPSNSNTDSFTTMPAQNPTPQNWQSWADWFNQSESQSESQNSQNQYSNYLPQGIPASAIPSGNEDLYILKSEVVPPVCPMCPTANCPPSGKKCPPCPACARCPEPAFECKKVPNYNTINDDMLPQPVLPGYSTFGM